MDTIKKWVNGLSSKDSTRAYESLKQLVASALNSNAIYAYFDNFAAMLQDKNAYIRMRGIVLIAASAQWDTDGKINAIIDTYLTHVTDEKPIVARQCIKALAMLSQHKPELLDQICSALHNADLSQYEDTLAPLILKDMQSALRHMEQHKDK